jgi:5'-nucleotidase
LKILVCNDDGIEAPGIHALADALKQIADVTVVAPVKEQSGVGHGITMQIPLRVIKYNNNGSFFGYAVNGTPADCVKMGVRNIMSELPDLVVSGINRGSNTAINIIYSGTVSAAREAAIMGIPAMAISLTSHEASDYIYSGKVARMLALKMTGKDLPLGTLLNVNVPNLPEDQIKGICLTTQGKSKWDDTYEMRLDPNGANYYWLTGRLVDTDTASDSDQGAVKKGFVSVSPIHFDLTDYSAYENMKNWNIEKLMDE